RLVVLESPDPMDMLQGRSEAQTLAAACRLVGYETASFTIRSARELEETCQFLSTITNEHDEASASNVPLFLHVSCLGNKDGLAFGQDFETWEKLVGHLRPLCKMSDYEGGLILPISACGAGHQEITRGLSGSFKKGTQLKPPHFLF